MSKALTKKLVYMSGNALEPAKEAPAASSFTKKMLHYPDSKEAAQIISEHAGLEFEQSEGKDTEKLKALQTDFDARFKAANDRQEALEDKCKNTNQYIKSNQSPNQDENSPSGFFQMSGYDLLSIALLFCAIPVTLFMGAANVYSNLMASGEEVFLKQPYLAVFIAMLMPAGSTAIKFISNFFDYQNSKKRYALSIYGLTAMALLTWSVFFSIEYTGVASGIDLNIDEHSTIYGSLLVWIQLLAEMLVSAALFLAAEDIYLKYSPNYYRESLDYINAKKALDDHQPAFEKLRDLRCQNIADIAVLSAKRQIHMNESMAGYMALRARFKQLNQF